MHDLIDEIFGDAVKPIAKPSDESLRRVAQLAEEQRKIESELARLKAEVDAKLAELARVRTKELPELMISIGLTSFKLADGSEIEIKPECFASIKQENRTAAHAWLRENGHGDLVKNEVVLSFGRGEDAKADEVEEWCMSQNLTYERTEQVHPTTLKAFVKEQIKKVNGEGIPFDLLGVHILSIAKITPPRAAKKGYRKWPRRKNLR